MGFILLFPAQTFNSTTWFGFNSWAVAKPFSENIIKLLGSVTHIKTHKQHAGLQPRTRQRDKANSNLFTACLPNGTSYSSQMANPTTEGVIIQLPLTHRSGEEPEQRQDTEQLVTGRAASQPSCTRQQPAADGQDTACSFATRITLLPRCGPGCTFISSWQVCCLFVCFYMDVHLQHMWESGPRCLRKICRAWIFIYLYKINSQISWDTSLPVFMTSSQ